MGQGIERSGIAADERIFVVSKICSLLQPYFSSDKKVLAPGFDVSCKSYLAIALATGNRHELDLAAIEFVGELHNGHTFFWDTWLDKNNQQPLGFYAVPMGGYWVVQISFLTTLKPGDVIVKIDDMPTEVFVQQEQRYIAASSTPAQRHNLKLWTTFASFRMPRH